MNMKIIGVGGAGVNILNQLIQSNKIQADFVAVNIDPKSLRRSKAKTKLNLDPRYRLAGGHSSTPERVYQSAWGSADALYALIDNARGVLILAGLGGDTGTGAAPVVAQIAREAGAAVVSLVTLPFRHEGPVRHMRAQVGLGVLQTQSDLVFKFPNEEVNLLSDLEDLDLHEAFNFLENRMVDAALAASDLFANPQVLTVDLEEWKSHLVSTEKLWLGAGHARGDNRIVQVVEQAFRNPLVEEIQISKATRIYMVLVCEALSLAQLNILVAYLKTKIPKNSVIKFGMAWDPRMSPDELRLSIWASCGLRITTAPNSSLLTSNFS
jgi:cell division protein FtsZ